LKATPRERFDGMPGGKGSTQTLAHLSLELRTDGNAIARQCSRPSYEMGAFRCANAGAYDCHYGSIVKSGYGWKVDIPDLRAPSKTARGLIEADEDGGIVVRYILPKYSACHFVRTNETPSASCTGD
jgi:hypothetical protein